MLYVLFGEMGVGKNYVGEKLAAYIGCEFLDGDSVIPKATMEKVKNFKQLNVNDINDYVKINLIPAIEKKLEENANLVVAQALYRKEHRGLLEKYFGSKNIKLIWLPIIDHFSHLKRLFKRPNGTRWILYMLGNKLFFQNPDSGRPTIVNVEGFDLTPQFRFIVSEQ